jgi:hypothetical protein
MQREGNEKVEVAGDLKQTHLTSLKIHFSFSPFPKVEIALFFIRRQIRIKYFVFASPRLVSVSFVSQFISLF